MMKNITPLLSLFILVKSINNCKDHVELKRV